MFVRLSKVPYKYRFSYDSDKKIQCNTEEIVLSFLDEHELNTVHMKVNRWECIDDSSLFGMQSKDSTAARYGSMMLTHACILP